MLVFLPSNHDLDKLAFKLPQLPAAGPNKIKPALRVVVYPPLEGIPIPSRNSNPEAHSLEITQVVDTLPWWEKNLQYSLPAYLSNTIDCNWDEVLGENIDKTKGKEIKETWYVLVYPPIAEAESEEFKHALECLNRKVVDLNYLRNYLQQGHGHGLHTFTFLIHQSLRRQLHLLPDLVRDGKKEARSYWFYGTKIEHQVIDERPQRIWQSGTIIFVTPQLILSCLEALKEFLYYADRKAATTKLALPSVWEEKVMEVMQNEPDQAVLNHVFDIKERIKRNSIILIPVDIHLGCDELDIYIDEFALYQLDNPFQFRRYWFGHLTLPDPGILELFKSIEFYTFELFKTQRNEEYKRTQRDHELRKSQANPSSSNAATIHRDLPQGPERRP
ncbi:hypothetical protein BGX38DRAFT_1328218 [Terfezia claveryi]|nr:hypothetical protein BGX38DRAFT_1328218 [Terfezia claveryi]